jgi:LPXTG-motif cell wall-anchored protein
MTSGRSVRRSLLSVSALTVGVAAAGALVAGPAVAAGVPDLKVTISTTPAKDSYAVGDAVTTVFTITNNGTATAVNARIDGGDEEGIDRKVSAPRDPFDLAPGATHTLTWDGTINQSGFRGGSAHGVWTVADDNGDANPADNQARYRLSVPGDHGVLLVKAFVDVKHDYDSTQPGRAGIKIDLADSTGKTVASSTTDSTSQVKFTGLVPGDYVLRAEGWEIEGENSANAEVRGEETAEVFLPLLPTGSGPASSPTAGASSSQPAAGGTGPATASSSAPATTGLAFTGSNTATVFLAGAVVLLIGGVAFLATRRRRRRFVA